MSGTFSAGCAYPLEGAGCALDLPVPRSRPPENLVGWEVFAGVTAGMGLEPAQPARLPRLLHFWARAVPPLAAGATPQCCRGRRRQGHPSTHFFTIRACRNVQAARGHGLYGIENHRRPWQNTRAGGIELTWTTTPTSSTRQAAPTRAPVPGADPRARTRPTAAGRFAPAVIFYYPAGRSASLCALAANLAPPARPLAAWRRDRVAAGAAAARPAPAAAGRNRVRLGNLGGGRIEHRHRARRSLGHPFLPLVRHRRAIPPCPPSLPLPITT